MMTLVEWLAADPERCSHGYHRTAQACPACAPTTEWGIFTAALREAARPNGEVHQDDVRPLIRGRIQPKHIGTLYRRAKAERVLTFLRKEPSGDVAGRNTHHDQPVYQIAQTTPGG